MNAHGGNYENSVTWMWKVYLGEGILRVSGTLYYMFKNDENKYIIQFKTEMPNEHFH